MLVKRLDLANGASRPFGRAPPRQSGPPTGPGPSFLSSKFNFAAAALWREPLFKAAPDSARFRVQSAKFKFQSSRFRIRPSFSPPSFCPHSSARAAVSIWPVRIQTQSRSIKVIQAFELPFAPPIGTSSLGFASIGVHSRFAISATLMFRSLGVFSGKEFEFQISSQISPTQFESPSKFLMRKFPRCSMKTTYSPTNSTLHPFPTFSKLWKFGEIW
jgi:hypothetical protein